MNKTRAALVALLLGFVFIGSSVLGMQSAVATGGGSGSGVITKYGTEFTYKGAGVWDVKNTDHSKALKNIGPTQSVLCTDYDTGLNKPCDDDAVYTFTSDATNNGQNCAYIQGDGGTHGSWDTVPGDPDKRVCADEPTTPTTTPPTTPTYPYEVTACWKMKSPDLVVGTYEFPQDYYAVDCSNLPEFACEPAEYQFDKYWIRDASDEAVFVDIKQNGLTSPADDNPLEPHGYYSVVVKEKSSLCSSTPPTPTETVTITPPAETETVTLPPVTVTETVTPPAETVTVTATPTATVTETVTAPPVTETATVTETPTTTVTETVTAPPVTETAKVTETPTVTVTETAKATETVTATATATSTVTEHTTEHVTKHQTDETVVYDWDTLPNTGLGKVFMAMFICGLALVGFAAWLAFRNRR